MACSRAHPGPDNLAFVDLIPTGEWQKIQDKFAILTDICVQTVTPAGQQITQPSKEPRFCLEIPRNSPVYRKMCSPCLPDFLGGSASLDKNLCFCCEAGLFHFVAPLRLSETRTLAYVILGPVILVMRKEKEEYRNTAEKLGIDPDAFWDRILEIKVISYQYMQAVSELVKDTGLFMLRLAYQAFEKRLILAERNASRPQKFFDDLLSVARGMSQADSGSIMLFDAAKQKMTIKSSYGIPQEIVQSAETPAGTGIAGMVADEGRARLITDKEADRKLRMEMKRPYLGEAMVLPLHAHDTVVGVMNLSLLKTSTGSFNPALLDQLTQLLNITSEQFTQ